MIDVDAELALALELADAADELTVERYRALDLVVETKPDLTPVSEADRAAEELLRDRISYVRPAHGILGEEFGAEGGQHTRWILDPIDATKNYVRGVPVWATLIALEHDGVVQVGVVSAPALRRRWWAARDRGAFADGEPIRVSSVARVADAHLAYDDVASFTACGREAQFLALARGCWRTRGFGDFWAHMLVAEGAVDAAIEPDGLHLWDLAAVQVVVEEAGGRFTDLGGVARADRGSAVSTNGRIHDDVLEALRRG
ncbi:MAG: histidinol-phosphatase [Acidimicrobiia bacterium]